MDTQIKFIIADQTKKFSGSVWRIFYTLSLFPDGLSSKKLIEATGESRRTVQRVTRELRELNLLEKRKEKHVIAEPDFLGKLQHFVVSQNETSNPNLEEKQDVTDKEADEQNDAQVVAYNIRSILYNTTVVTKNNFDPKSTTKSESKTNVQLNKNVEEHHIKLAWDFYNTLYGLRRYDFRHDARVGGKEVRVGIIWANDMERLQMITRLDNHTFKRYIHYLLEEKVPRFKMIQSPGALLTRGFKGVKSKQKFWEIFFGDFNRMDNSKPTTYETPTFDN